MDFGITMDLYRTCRKLPLLIENYIDWKFQGQKPRPMEILHGFLLNNPENSTTFLINPLNFYMLFL